VAADRSSGPSPGPYSSENAAVVCKVEVSRVGAILASTGNSACSCSSVTTVSPVIRFSFRVRLLVGATNRWDRMNLFDRTFYSFELLISSLTSAGPCFMHFPCYQSRTLIVVDNYKVIRVHFFILKVRFLNEKRSISKRKMGDSNRSASAC
jgi:hypothetical protein